MQVKRVKRLVFCLGSSRKELLLLGLFKGDPALQPTFDRGDLCLIDMPQFQKIFLESLGVVLVFSEGALLEDAVEEGVRLAIWVF